MYMSEYPATRFFEPQRYEYYSIPQKTASKFPKAKDFI